MRITRRRAVSASIAFAVAGLSEPLAAADYPSRPIKMVVPYPPGGGVDVMARVLAAALGERVKETVIVENKPGASGMIGTEYVAKAAPDGYTIMLAPADTHSINPNVYTSIRYDARQDFEPIALLGNLPMTLVSIPTCRPRAWTRSSAS